MNALRSLLLVVAAFAGIVLALAFVLVFFGQRRLIFPGASAGRGEPAAVGGERIWLEAGAVRTEAWLLPARRGEAAGPLLLFAHGNGELIDHWADAFEPAAREASRRCWSSTRATAARVDRRRSARSERA